MEFETQMHCENSPSTDENILHNSKLR